MNDLPQPLTPSDCDLRDFAFMPLDVARLRDSDLAAYESPEACWASVLLWSTSWHQLPAASLPDDDRFLAKAAGYGRVVKEWQSVRQGALHGWVKCADGRLYHPVVAEKALESWHKKVVHQWKKECDRIRKANKQRADEGKPALPFPPEPVFTKAAFPKEAAKIPAEIGANSVGNPRFSTDPSQLGLGEAAVFLSAPHDADDEEHYIDSSKQDVSAVPPEKEEIPPESGIGSAGNEKSSAGIPLEKALKGQGEGQGEGEYIKPSHLSVTASSGGRKAEAAGQPPAERSQKRNVEIAVLLREKGVKPFTFAHPQATEWAANPHVTDAILIAAVQSARDYKPTGDISPNYLRPIVEQLLNPPEPKPKAAVQDTWWTSDAGIDRKGRELGMMPKPTENYASFKDRIFEELRKRGGKAA